MNWKKRSAAWLIGAYIGVLGIVGAQRDRVWANELTFRETVRNTDFVTAGVGGLRDATSASLYINGIKGTVRKAYLYWHGPMNTDYPLANASIRMNGQTITGVHIGTSDDNCWGFLNSQAYRADVTAQVTARRNGAYALSQFVKQGTNINANGASLLVFFDDGNTNNNRDIVLFEGNDSNAPNSYDDLGWNAVLPGVIYVGGTGYLQVHVSDGQIYPDDSVILNDAVFKGRGSTFQGVTVPADNTGPYGWGNLWDIKTWDITSFLTRGTNDLHLTHGYIERDCISLVVAAFNLPAASGPTPPPGATNTAPTVVGQPEITLRSPAPVVLEADARDNDGDSLDYTITVDSAILQLGEVPAGFPQTIGRLGLTNAFTVGEHIVVFTVSDGRTNASYTTLVHVIDNTPPVVNAPNIVVPTDPGKTTARVNYTVTATDDFPGAVAIVSLPAPGNDFPIGVTTVTVAAVDASGNRTQTTFTITVLDAILPTINCPADLVRLTDTNANAKVAHVTYTVPAGDNQPGVNVVCTPPSGSAFPVGTTPVNCVATDVAGNQARCGFNVIVSLRPPVNRPPTVTGVTNLVLNSNAPVVLTATAADPDGNPLAYVIRIDGVVVQTGTVPAGSPATLGTLTVTNAFSLGSHTVSFEVNDGQASATLVTTVRVLDDTPPTINVPANIVVPVDPGSDHAIVTFTVEAHDNFPGDLQVVIQPPSGSSFPVGTTTVVVIATDSSGNSSTNRFTVTVVDNLPPTINCPADLVRVATPGTNNAVVTYAVTSSDNVPGHSLACVPPSGSVFPAGATDVRCTATDAAGNHASCSFRVTVQLQPGNRVPRLTGQTNLTLTSNAPVVVSATAIDLDGDALTYSIRIDGIVVQTGAIPAGNTITSAALSITNTFSLGDHTVTFEVSDGLGVATLTTVVHVIDNTPPVIQVPPNLTIPLEPGASNAVVTYTVTATDNFPGPVDVIVRPPSGSVFPVGTTTVVVIARDSSGNSATNTFTVTVVDTIPPTIICSPDLVRTTAPGATGANVEFTVRAYDNLPGATVTCVPPSGSFFSLGTTTVTCTAADATRLCSQCTFTVTVNRPNGNPTNHPPAVAGQAEIIVNRPFPIEVEALARDDDGDPLSYTIEIDGVAVRSGTIPAGSPQTLGHLVVTNAFTLGNHPVVFRVNDGSTNASFTTLVRVVDNTPPEIHVPANIVVPVDPGKTTALVNYTVSAVDEFPGTVTITSQPPSGSRFPLGTTTVVVTAVDQAGNRSTASFTVTVVDNVPPIIRCPGDITTCNDPGVRVAIVRYTVNATDNVPGVTVTCAPPSGSAFQTGTTVVNCVARDAAGNTDTCSFKVKVKDLPPVVVIPTNTVVATDLGQCSAVVNYSVRVVDNAPGWTIACSPPPGSSFPKGETPVICVATDSAANRVTNMFKVIVQDRETPLLRVPADITVQVATNAASAVVNFTATATDNCPGVAVVCEPPSGSTFPVGTTIVQCTATDTSGNVAIASFKVRVLRKPGCRGDDEPPTIQCVTPSKRCLWPPNHKMVTVTFKTSATDNSGQPVSAEVVSVTSDDASGSTGSSPSARDYAITGPLTVQLRAERSGRDPHRDRTYRIVIAVRDAAGNIATETTSVHVPHDQSRYDALIAADAIQPKPNVPSLPVRPAKMKWNWQGPWRN